MTRNQVDLANMIGQPHGVKCEYVFDTSKSTWCWRFYRNRVFVKQLGRASAVIEAAERLVRQPDLFA